MFAGKPFVKLMTSSFSTSTSMLGYHGSRCLRDAGPKTMLPYFALAAGYSGIKAMTNSSKEETPDLNNKDDRPSQKRTLTPFL